MTSIEFFFSLDLFCLPRNAFTLALAILVKHINKIILNRTWYFVRIVQRVVRKIDKKNEQTNKYVEL